MIVRPPYEKGMNSFWHQRDYHERGGCPVCSSRSTPHGPSHYWRGTERYLRRTSDRWGCGDGAVAVPQGMRVLMRSQTFMLRVGSFLIPGHLGVT